ncbi:MAG: LytTR family DNA-binding domain-containing protein, partial [Bacteroidetes bacterium]|nr:LytTR family DNA-binding domain-containing protein [Bacteroidota bacterium]
MEYFSDFQIIGKYTNCKDALMGILKKKPVVLFLDINMPNEDGISLLAQIQHLNIKTIFVTAHSEYALEALQQGAFDYLLKPLNIEELNRVHDKLKKLNLSKTEEQNERIRFQISNKIFLYEKEEIIYANSQGNYTTIVSTNQKPLVITKNLKKIELEYLDKLPFYRTHQSYIVNINHVKECSNLEILLSNGDKALISNKNYSEFSSMLR